MEIAFPAHRVVKRNFYNLSMDAHRLVTQFTSTVIGLRPAISFCNKFRAGIQLKTTRWTGSWTYAKVQLKNGIPKVPVFFVQLWHCFIHSFV